MRGAKDSLSTALSSVAKLSLSAVLATSPFCSSSFAKEQEPPKIPRVQANGGLQFQSQGEGAPNTFTGYLFAPFTQSDNGDVAFLDLAGILNLGGPLKQTNDANVSISTRLGYRWLNSKQKWIYGVNAGVDARQAYSDYAFQAGVGGEALSKDLELRVNGYIPFYNKADYYATGWTNAYLTNNQLLLDGWNRYVVSLGGVNLEAGIPLARWQKNSLWLHSSYYYLDGSYLSGSSGVRGRAELRIGSQLAMGATVSYDNIFDVQATGYIRYGSKPISGNARDSVTAAEREFLALRGLPMQRQTDIRMVSAQEDLPRSIAINPATGEAWVVRCTGQTSSTYSVNCGYGSLDSLLAAAGSGDVLLIGGDASSNLASQPLDSSGRPTYRLAAGTHLTASGYAPSLNTQFGSVNLNPVFGSRVGAQPSFSNGVISIGSNTTIAGFNFTNTSITNYSTSNVLVANNTFTGSYSPTPGANNYNQNALPTIDLTGVSDVTISNNSFSNPNVQSYTSATGDGGTYVCDGGICLSGNAIRIGASNTGTVSRDITISGNTISGALDEAIRLDNVNGTININGNRISGMRNGPDSNMQAAIFIRQWTGDSQITVQNNQILDNEAGVNTIKAGGTVANGELENVGGKNIIDALEIGLCRGNLTFSNRSGDKYGDDFGGFNCNQSAPASMTYTARNNTITPSSNATSFDEDGIDFNVGSYGIFNALVENNTVNIKSDRNNAFTADFRGDNRITLSILNNSLTSTNPPISIEGGTLSGLTSYSGAGGTVYISGNTLTNTRTGRTDELINLTSVARNPSSSYSATPAITPIFRVTAQSPTYPESNIVFEQENFGVAGNNDYPSFYVNNVELPWPPS